MFLKSKESIQISSVITVHDDHIKANNNIQNCIQQQKSLRKLWKEEEKKNEISNAFLSVNEGLQDALMNIIKTQCDE